MKKIILKSILSLLTLLTMNSLWAHEENSKRANPLSINKRTIDSSLTEGTARFVVTFYGDGNKMTQAVNIGMNDVSFYKTPDISGVVNLSATPKKYKLYFHVSGMEEVISDSIKISSKEIVEITVRFAREYRDVHVKKPVIYVYPEETTEVKIQLDVNGKLGFTYPEYNEGWNFTASPDGNISMNGKEYNYLFWESEMPDQSLDKTDMTGFLVATDTLLSFLENSLDQMGFNSKESADFITFWYPEMMKNEKNHVQFLFNDACNVYAELNISPKPDQIYRVGMLWTEAKTDFVPETQIIPTLNRNGFTVIEWGGSEVENLFTEEN